jgi:hypothetical protein
MTDDTSQLGSVPQRSTQPQESALGWLSNPADVRVVEGLTRRCSLCGVKPNVWCVYLHSRKKRPELHMWRAGEAA